MKERINPFHDLYLTEAIGPDSFVSLFSPIFMSQGGALFQPGNVILKGLQGSGKTMLLNLLKLDIRMAYHRKNIEFPVPRSYRKFISAGINLRKSGVAEFAQVILPESTKQDIRELALFFGDFINYWVVLDLVQTIGQLVEEGERSLAEEIGVRQNVKLLDSFAHRLSTSDCWLGGLDEVKSAAALTEQIKSRIVQYRNYININIDELPERIRRTKTVIGEPISEAADLLRDLKVIDDNTSVFIRVDQYEELPTLDFSGQQFGRSCQELIHKALSSRSSRVSYRIGTRQYAWPERPVIFATQGALELKRDYSIVNIDDKLRRQENRRTWLFPELAEDVFKRRLRLTDYSYDSLGDDGLKAIFGASLKPRKKAELLVPSPESRKSMLRLDNDWPAPWKGFLRDLAVRDPMSAKLGEAWANQKDAEKRAVVHEAVLKKPYPWDKPYWKKERLEQALTQIASRNRQQLIWQGKDDVLGLSGGNILVFLFVCQHIWDAWLRDTRSQLDRPASGLPNINIEVQSIGIINASEEWQKKPIEGKRSKQRYSFIKSIGERYYRKLTDDYTMSYPGHNGFSLSVSGIEQNRYVAEFLKVAVDYGDLYEGHHTSKAKGQMRRKYYLAPILCPAFRIPYKHTKEPEYISAGDIQRLLEDENGKALANGASVAKSGASPKNQLDLYGE